MLTLTCGNSGILLNMISFAAESKGLVHCQQIAASGASRCDRNLFNTADFPVSLIMNDLILLRFRFMKWDLSFLVSIGWSISRWWFSLHTVVYVRVLLWPVSPKSLTTPLTTMLKFLNTNAYASCKHALRQLVASNNHSKNEIYISKLCV